MSMKASYNENYFEWQKNVGSFGGVANLFKFEEFTSPQAKILDFGCGGGFLLKNITAKEKNGFDVNKTALENAASFGVKTYTELSDIPDGSLDLIISNHALEHVESPFHSLKALREKLNDGGRAVFVVPHEDYRHEFKEDDINMHLFTWNPLTLGNLFKAAGYKVEKVDLIRHRWPRNYLEICQKYGWNTFHRVCKVNAILKKNYQVRIVARKG